MDSPTPNSQSGSDRSAGAPSDHTTLTEVLGHFAEAGYVCQFDVGDDGTVGCLECHQRSRAADMPQHTIRRLEGASDPDDMVLVAALTCPRCGARGTLVVPFGPAASAAEGLVLRELRDARGQSDAPQNSAPGEAVGDHRPTAGHDALPGDVDVLPGDVAPRFAAPASTGHHVALDSYVGKVPVALTFTGTMPPNAASELVDTFDDSFSAFGRQRVQSLVVVPETRTHARRRRLTGTTVPVLADEEGQLLEMYAPSSTFPATVLIDQHGVVARLLEGGGAADHLAAVLASAQDVR